MAQLLERALGRVLFIDEAYRLAEGHFAKEAVDELVGLLTQDKFKGKVVVILAGYEEHINTLLSVNPGLSSRFPHEFVFTNISPEACLEILAKKLAADDVTLPALADPTSILQQQLVSFIDQLCQLPSWGNARDMETVAKAVTGRTMQDQNSVQPDGTLLAKEVDVVKEFRAMLHTRKQRREKTKPSADSFLRNPPMQMNPSPAAPSPPNITTIHATAHTRKVRVLTLL